MANPENPASSPGHYAFPDAKLKQKLSNQAKKPLVLVACGSFSPITYLHLRMFEMASDYVRLHTDFEVVGCFISPVSDAYKKKGLASAQHSPLLMVDVWEALKPEYTPTAQVLDHLDHELNVVRNGIKVASGESQKVQISLLAGGDLIETFLTPGVWAETDLYHILERYGAFVIERSGTDLKQAVSKLKQPTDKIHTVPQEIRNDISSTKIREFISKGLSVHYLIPPNVVEYVDKHGLYREPKP
ncbi:MAG: hypothetical protein LQ340_007593 [Diploschistes diacapsis]|nr:MAG: hypothetical protein LQ340_007593 [Diploschistes diacapsis]